jgi:hypothetical protein
MPPRFVIQGIVKKLARSMGLEIRYAFQNPPLTSAAIYAPWLVRDNVTCIFDVWANVGQSAQAFAREFSGSTIHSFEPFPAAYGRLDCRCASARESFGSQVLARNVPTISLALASSLTLEIEEQKITFFYYLAELRCINGRNIAPPETRPPANFRAESKAPGLSTTPRG